MCLSSHMATASPIVTSQTPVLDVRSTAGRLDLVAGGAWTAVHADALERLVDGATPKVAGASQVFLDIGKVDGLDTFGAWLLERLARRPDRNGKKAELTGVSPRYHGLIEEMHAVNLEPSASARARNPVLATLESIGRAAATSATDLTMFLGMLGEFAAALGRVLVHPRRFRLTSTIYQLYRVGWLAVPIMVLITFLIGAIIAQQGIFHFRKFGAESYVVDMVGILVLREIGVLLVSIMIAGRSGSSYTAELGAMKMREEIDALRTMGFDPVEVLIVPRIIALVCALPILAFLGSMAALYGGGLVAWLYGGMSPAVFIARLRDAISVTHFEVGMIKAPFMALAIGVVACSEGLAVKGSAESLGTQTTVSVVKSIFLVIVLDGLFAVFFASIGM
jgi:phospholipid/cholesterol/gamma-HCH transport system permease protein